jgi:hypothetical protein
MPALHAMADGTIQELFPKAVDGPGDSSGFSFSVDVLDAVDYLL